MKEQDLHKPVASSYHTITEAPGMKATREQLARIYHRYRFAYEYAHDAVVLEAACGSGIGLGYLARTAQRVVGGDIDEVNLSVAREIYKYQCDDSPVRVRPEIVWLDAQELSFPDATFDLVLLFEAVYYLAKPERFVAGARRILKKNGRLIVGTVNKDWKDFHPSPYTHRYFSVPELDGLLRRDFSCVTMYGAFPIPPPGPLQRMISLIKRTAVRLDLIPGSLAARAYLKRLFLGPLEALPSQLEEGMTSYVPPVAIPDSLPNSDYKIIYAVATGDR